ncbi:cyclophilin-like fold protein [Microbacterium sp.]|uniref:cyclophilin-like fold protein n=1 Tax=Microbacterium sp. TaxID=51671 RepID=UPI003C712782
MTETPICFVLGEQIVDARLWNNPAAQSLLDQLPVSLDFSDYGRQEVLAEPPIPLTMEGMPRGESAPAGTIGYYAPGGVVVLYYTDVPSYPGIVRIGQIDGDVSVFRGWSGSRAVTIERAG